MTGVSTLAQALSQINNIKAQQSQFSTLNLQLATGKKTQQFSGLGTDALRSQRARADFQSLDSYIGNIQRSQSRVGQMLNAVEQFQEFAKQFDAALVGFTQDSAHQVGEEVVYDDPATTVTENTILGYSSADPDADFEELKRLADDFFTFLGTILNSQDGDRYILTGSETTTPPFNDSGPLDAAISTVLQDWKNGTVTNAELIADLQERQATTANPNALSDSVIGFSAALSAGNVENVFLQVSDVAQIEYTVLANDQAFRDVMVAMAYIKNEDLGPIADAYIPPNAPPNPPDVQGAPGADLQAQMNNFYEVFNSLLPSVSRAIDGLDAVRFKLETVNARLATLEENYKQSQNVLLNTVSEVEDVDVNEVAVRLNILQTQLEASFSITARLQEITLTRFL